MRILFVQSFHDTMLFTKDKVVTYHNSSVDVSSCVGKVGAPRATELTTKRLGIVIVGKTSFIHHAFIHALYLELDRKRPENAVLKGKVVRAFPKIGTRNTSTVFKT